MWPSLDAAQVYLVIQMGFQKIKKIYAMWLLDELLWPPSYWHLT